MSLIQAKQIAKILLAPVQIAAFTAGTSTSDPITSALSTALGSLPTTVGNTTTEGVSTGAGANGIPIYLSSTGKRLQDANANDVYATLSFASNVYTMSYFSNVNGTATAFTMSGQSISFGVPYFYAFADLPAGALYSPTESYLTPDPAITTRIKTDILNVTATNTLSNTTFPPIAGSAVFSINGQSVAQANGFTLNGSTFTPVPGTIGNPSAGQLGYNVTTSDQVSVTYSY